MVSNSAMSLALVAGERGWYVQLARIVPRRRLIGAGRGSAAWVCSEKGTGMGRWGKSLTGLPVRVWLDCRVRGSGLAERNTQHTNDPRKMSSLSETVCGLQSDSITSWIVNSWIYRDAVRDQRLEILAAHRLVLFPATTHFNQNALP